MKEKINSRALFSGIAAIIMSTCAITPFLTMSLYMRQLSQSIGASIGEIAVATSVSTAGSIVGSLTVGRALKTMNQKVMIILAGLLVFAFQFTISVSESVAPIYIAALFNGFGMTWGGRAMAQIIISQWFVKARATMMSVCSIVMSLTLTVMIPIIGAVIGEAGYRPIAMLVGAAAGAGIIISAFITSGAPEKYGQKPYGAASSEAPEKTFPASSFASVLKSSVFWAILIIVVLSTTVMQGFNSQAAVIFGSFGLAPVRASHAFAVFNFLGLPFQFAFGFLCDKIGPKSALTINGCICGVVLAASFLWSGFAGALLTAFGLAAGGGISGLYGPNMAQRLFGAKNVGDMVGFIIMASSVGAAIGPLFFGFMYDSLGNYTAVRAIMGGIVVICLVINFWLNGKKNLEKIQTRIEKENFEKPA